MRRALIPLLLPLLGPAHAPAAGRTAAPPAAPQIAVEGLASPAAPGAVGASLARAPDGSLWLSWVQPARGQPHAIRFATLEAAARSWSPPGTIAADGSVTTSAMDFPQLAPGTGGSVTAIWTDGRGGAHLSRSLDRGRTWSPPEPFSRDGHEVEKFSLAALADGRVLVAWLDSRSLTTGGKMPQLFARVLGSPAPDTLVDPAVCECCPTTLTAFPDGTALLAYRGRTAEQVRDIRIARFRGQVWEEPRPLNHDDWRINACPVNGPRLDNDRGRVAAAWFTAAGGEPRVVASYSPDAGARFLLPLRLDRGAPVGHVDTVMLRDGAMLVSWLEQDGSLWLRRVSPDFAADAPIELAAPAAGRISSFPRLALARDYAGGRTPAQLVVVFARDHQPATLHTLLVTVPEGELLAAAKDCDCVPTAEELLGLPVRGTVVAVEPGALRVRHGEIPGVLPAGTHRFQVAPEVLAAAAVGREFLARGEARDGTWRLFDVRLLASATP